MYKNFATVNIDTNKPNTDQIHVVNVKFPPDQVSSDLLENIAFYKSFVHDFRVETSDKTSSLNDIFVSMVPIGSVVQNITVRYLELPERATIGLEYLPGHIESVHIISSIISQDDIQRAISIVENNDKISIRLTGLFKEQYNVKNSYVKIGKDHIVISKNITTKNEEMGPILDESDALQYIFDRKKYVNEIKDE